MVFGYTVWMLSDQQRGELLELIPAVYPRIIAHHVTKEFDVPESSGAPENEIGKIYKIVDDGKGVQGILVRVNNSRHRSDRHLYHITWSLADGRKPVETNFVADNTLFHSNVSKEISDIEIELEGAFIPFA
jgi:hypothetical protein